MSYVDIKHTVTHTPMGVCRGGRAGNVSFTLLRKIKIINMKKKIRRKNDYKKKKREDFNYVSKGMLKLIISYMDFRTRCVLAMDSHFFFLF